MSASQKTLSSRLSNDPEAALALEIIAQLVAGGYVAFLAGGCVRDMLLEKTPKDYDVATNAHPNQIQQLFGKRRTLAIGAAFGVICVLGKKSTAGQQVEVATFRSDGPYSDGRRPDTVIYSTPEQDAWRRDFTINGLFYDPNTSRVIDYVGGAADIRKQQIRAIGDPVARFREDKLRLLRAIRFATTYQFRIEAETWEAIVAHAPDVTVCSGERIGAEMRRLLCSPHAADGVGLLYDCGLAKAIMPNVASGMANLATQHQLIARLNTQAKLAPHSPADFSARLALLALAADRDAILTLDHLSDAWRLSNDETEATAFALRDLKKLFIADQLPWSELQPCLVHRFRDTSLTVAKTCLLASGDNPAAIDRLDAALQLPPSQLDPPPLLRGADLIQLGLEPSPRFKSLLEKLRRAQLDGQLTTAAEAKQAILDNRFG